MNSTRFPSVLLVLFILVQLNEQGQSMKYGVKEFLVPLQDLQVVLRVPTAYYSPLVLVPLQRAVIILTQNSRPFQLLQNDSVSASPHVGHHVQNQVAWIVLARKNPERDPIRVAHVLKTFSGYGRDYFFHSLYHNLIHLLVVEQNFGESFVRGYVRRCSTPFYLLLAYWHPPDLIRPDQVYAFDVCVHQAGCRTVHLPHYFLATKYGGVEAILKIVDRTRKDFLGEHIHIAPILPLPRRWESWSKFMNSPLRNVKYNQLKHFYVGAILWTLTQNHNLTFDTIKLTSFSTDYHTSCDAAGTIHMGHIMICKSNPCFSSVQLSFLHFSDVSTLMSSSLTSPDFHLLSSLGTAVGKWISLLVPTAGILICFIIAISSWNRRNRFRLNLWYVIPLTSEEPRSGAAYCLSLHLLWVICGCFLGILYISLLESAAVAPVSQHSDISFDQMVQQNFTFLADYPEFIYEASMMTKEILDGRAGGDGMMDFLQDEAMLAELLLRGERKQVKLGSVLLESSPRNRKVLLLQSENQGVIVRILKFLNRNILFGKEKFFVTPAYWEWGLEKQWMLGETLERIKSAGLVYDFLDRAEGALYKDWIDMVQEELEGMNRTSNQHRHNEHDDRFLDDSIVSETFLLFLYCISICSIYFVLRHILAKSCCSKGGRSDICNVT